jgi:hypothetical protein
VVPRGRAAPSPPGPRYLGRVGRVLLTVLRWTIGLALLATGVVGALVANTLPLIVLGVALLACPCALRIARMPAYQPGGLAATGRTLAVLALPALALLTLSLLLLETRP